MKAINILLDAARERVRWLMAGVARRLNRLTGGRIHPNAITITALLAHLPIAWLIALQTNVPAAILLIVFGLFDALDGGLARLQNRVSNAGMLLDATTDRMKEVLLYSGAAYALAASGQVYMGAWAVAACGGSLLVSYVKAKGETAVAGGDLPASEVNRLFQDGLMRFEVRMTALIIGLFAGQLAPAIIFIAVGSWLTAFGRLLNISRKISSS
jgi:phosphatidylglycerophosphate synthase